MANGNSSNSPAPQPGLWRFGKAVLDEQMATLRVGETPIDLDRSSYDVLLALLRHAGEVVTKDELLEAGWPGRVVSENSLAKAVSRLRQALGEDGELIRVVHGYGYRLAAAVSFQAIAAEKVSAHPHEASHLHEGDPLPHRPGWRLGRRLGEGGAGVIFLARADANEHHAREERAIKFATSEAGLRSLKREISLARYFRAVKAELPGVARVIGWNLTQPPFFLELPHFADGHLGDWANAPGGLASLPQRARIALCAQLCETVAGLHEIGVIHKDLKPENLYPCIDADGGWRVVLADLGAGEAMQSPRLAELGITLSIAADQLSQRAGSLLYLAPEVIAGEIPTQRSDVFALGVLIYQIVVGDLRRSLAPGWEADVDDELLREDIALAAAANPLRREVDARALAQRLRSLDARGAQREAARREEQRAAQRERDLQRERSRRRIWIATATASALGLIGTLSMYAYAESARRTAERNAQQRQALVDFVTKGVLQQADPFAGNSGAITLRDAVDRAAKDVDSRFGDSPDVAAAIHGTLGATYEGMNDFNTAVAHYRAQLAGLRRGPSRDPAAVARASAAVCTAQIWQGDLAKIQPACDQARDDYIAAGLEPDRPEVFMALVDSRQNQSRRGLARLEPRMARIRQSGDDDLLGFADWFASILYSRLGRIADAERASAELVEVRTRQSGDGMQLAWALTEHGRHLLQLGRIDEGKARLERGRLMFVKAAGEGHPQSLAPAIHLSSHELALGHWQQARDLAEPAYRTLLKEVSWEHWTIYAALNTMAAAAELHDRDAAHRVMAEFDAMAEQGLDNDFPYLREPHWVGYAQAHLALGEYDQAERYIRKLKGLAAESGSGALLRARAACLEGRLQLARGQFEPARANALACRRDAIAATSPDSPYLAIPDRLLASLGQR
ncbi:winged helix-turn-helix domain-containing protein [Lysobacter niabensis]|uniref:protein kinase domain-containing protein n=1 Tax=Agrilutibacter niabensis TaxID=380628 RepID=UPI00360E03B1